ncbi:Histone-lysine N-methyltransferase SUVR5 [Hordeum vulgare]|nr:Histone-lysine N-methyltransferase SUVR5 [Hordeum vulgare]
MSVMPDYPDTINIDAPEKDGVHVHVVDKKRKRAGFMEEELIVFSSMTHAVKEVAITIGESKTADVYPEMYTS